MAITYRTPVGSIAHTMDQRQQFEQQQYEAALARKEEERAFLREQQAEDMELRREVKRSRLGLNGLDNMLTDRYSDAYQTVDASGAPVPTGVDMTIGSVDGGAPAPLPQVRTRPLGLNRMIKPEFEDDLAALGQRSGRTLSTEEFRERELIKAQHAREIAELKARLKAAEAAQNNLSRGTIAMGAIQARRLDAPATATDDALTTLTQINSQALSEPPAIQAPAFSDEVAPGGGTGDMDLFRKAKAKFPDKSDEEIQAEIQRLKEAGLI